MVTETITLLISGEKKTDVHQRNETILPLKLTSHGMVLQLSVLSSGTFSKVTLIAALMN